MFCHQPRESPGENGSATRDELTICVQRYMSTPPEWGSFFFLEGSIISPSAFHQFDTYTYEQSKRLFRNSWLARSKFLSILFFSQRNDERPGLGFIKVETRYRACKIILFHGSFRPDDRAVPLILDRKTRWDELNSNKLAKNDSDPTLFSLTFSTCNVFLSHETVNPAGTRDASACH